MSLSNVISQQKANVENKQSNNNNNGAKSQYIEGNGFKMRFSEPLNHKTAKNDSLKRIQSDLAKIRQEFTEQKIKQNKLDAIRLKAEQFKNDSLKITYTGRNFVDKKGKRVFSVKYPPAIIKDYFKTEEPVLNMKQREYRKNTISKEDLYKETQDVIVSNNPLKGGRYIFMVEIKRCLPGIIYYSAPLLFSIIFLFMDLFIYNFWVNFAVATYSLITFLIARKAIKSNYNVILKFLAIAGILTVTILLAYLIEKGFPDFFEQIKLAFTLKLFTLAFGIFYFGKYYYLFFKMYHQDCNPDVGNVVTVNYGSPGTGKTSNGIHEAYILALLKWRQLQLDVIDVHSREKEILAKNDTNELLKRYEILSSYNFYIMRPCIPCLWSNIEIYDTYGGKNNVRRCHEIEIDHLRGIKRLPVYCVVLFDEIGVVLKSQLSFEKTENYDFSDMFRLGRQFLKWSVICCEQDPSNIYIDCRRVVGKNRGFKGQTWVNQPILLCKLYSFLNFFRVEFCDKKIKRHPKFAKFMNSLGGFISGIGFRVQTVTSMGNTQTGISGEQKNGEGLLFNTYKYRIMPPGTAVNYDDCYYEREYPSRYDKYVEGHLVYENDFGNKVVGYYRQFVSKTALLEEKRQAIDDIIKKIS